MRTRAQFDFSWIFAMIVGGMILFLAIYGAMRFGDTIQLGTDSDIAKSLSIITDPMQAGFGEGKVSKIIFRQETRINNICQSDYQGFGKNQIPHLPCPLFW